MSTLTNIAVSALTGGAAAGVVLLAGTVNLQDTTPGTVQTGHSNISGYALAGRFGAGASPTLARIQVKETGTIQGVRAESGSGVAVFGKSTALSGLGAGGYFTSSSVGGRGIVGDALSGSGNTVGGLFYNRSTTGGTAVWGKHIGTAGNTLGVLGEVASATGIAGGFSNSSLGSRVDLAGPNGTVYVGTGSVSKNFGTGARSAIPIAYGTIDIGGSIYFGGGGSGNWTVTKPGTGDYRVTIAGENYTFGPYTTVATVTYGGEVSTSSTSGNLAINTYDSAGADADKFITFVTYKSVPGAVYPPTPKHGFKNDLEWARRRPTEFAAYRAKCDAAERAALPPAGWDNPSTPPNPAQ